MKKVKYTFITALSILVLYFIGPRQRIAPLDHAIQLKNGSTLQIESEIRHKENSLDIKENNQARIVWFDELKKEKTDFVLLYLHGFSASQYEGFPLHTVFAKRYGCNLYLARLAAHGLRTDDAMLDMQPYNLYESAKEALAIALGLGKKVIIMSTSTGGTLSLQLAADFPDLVHSLIMYSPNVQIKDKTAKILTGPWGLQIGRLAVGGKYRHLDNSPEESRYWYSNYRVEGVVYLQALIEQTMRHQTFEAVTQPAFVGYYYKDEEHQDQVVEVEKIKEMFTKLGTDKNKKQLVAFPNAGAHVIACDITSGAVPEVKEATFRFAEDVLGLKKMDAFKD